VGWQYRRVGGIDPVWAANVRWLAGYRHPRCFDADRATQLREVLSAPLPLSDAVSLVGDRLAVLPVLFHLLWTGVLVADLRSAPLAGHTVVPLTGGGPVTVSRPPVLAVGDQVRFEGSLWTVTSMGGGTIGWVDPTGGQRVVPFADLFADEGFAVPGPSARRAPLPPAVRLAGLDKDIIVKSAGGRVISPRSSLVCRRSLGLVRCPDRGSILP
jgi:hypothetical protein